MSEPKLSTSIQDYIELLEMDGSIADPILIEFREEAAALEAKLETMEQNLVAVEKRFALAWRHVNKGIGGERAEFMCSHCGKNTPLLIEALFAAAAQEEQGAGVLAPPF